MKDDKVRSVLMFILGIFVGCMLLLCYHRMKDEKQVVAEEPVTQVTQEKTVADLFEEKGEEITEEKEETTDFDVEKINISFNGKDIEYGFIYGNENCGYYFFPNTYQVLEDGHLHDCITNDDVHISYKESTGNTDAFIFNMIETYREKYPELEYVNNSNELGYSIDSALVVRDDKDKSKLTAIISFYENNNNYCVIERQNGEPRFTTSVSAKKSDTYEYLGNEPVMDEEITKIIKGYEKIAGNYDLFTTTYINEHSSEEVAIKLTEYLDYYSGNSIADYVIKHYFTMR